MDDAVADPGLFGWRREMMQRDLREAAAAAAGHPVCGKVLAPDKVCRLDPGHHGGCEW